MEELHFGGVDTYYSDSQDYGLQQAAFRSTMNYNDATAAADHVAAAAAATVHDGMLDGKTMKPVLLLEELQTRDLPATAGDCTVDEMMHTLGMDAVRQQSAHQMHSMTVEDAWAVVDTNGR